MIMLNWCGGKCLQSSTWEVEVGRSGIQSQLWPCNEFRTSLGYMRPFCVLKELMINSHRAASSYVVTVWLLWSTLERQMAGPGKAMVSHQDV